MWMAASTSRIALGTNVLGLPYRHPPVVAKMAESFDRLVAGEPGRVAERLKELLRLGFTCRNFWVSGDRVEQRERLAEEVLPAVRQLAS